jgi:hypothetical protein
MRLDPVRLGLAYGLIEAFLLFLFTLLAIVGHGEDSLSKLKEFLPGYEITMIGSLVGAGYGFIAGFIKFFCLAFLYNMFGSQKE